MHREQEVFSTRKHGSLKRKTEEVGTAKEIEAAFESHKYSHENLKNGAALLEKMAEESEQMITHEVRSKLIKALRIVD